MDTANISLLRLLRVLIAERNVTRAADRLGLSQPAASQALGRLRRIFHDPLLVQSRNEMIPTARALEIDRGLADMLTTFDGLIDDQAAFHAETSRRRFSISATEYSEFVLLPALVANVRKVAPGITIDIRAPNQDLMSSWLESGEIDLRIAWIKRPSQSLKAQPLFFDQLVWIARRDHPAVRRPPTIEEFLNLPHARASLIGRTMIGQVIDDAVTAIGKSLNLTITAPNFLTLPYLVAASDIVAIVPKRLAQAFATELSLQTLDLPLRLPRMRYAAYWHERNHLDAGHKWFRQMVTKTAKALPPI